MKKQIVCVCAFDDSSENKITDPELNHIHRLIYTHEHMQNTYGQFGCWTISVSVGIFEHFIIIYFYYENGWSWTEVYVCV